jgi:hypothetical protein
VKNLNVDKPLCKQASNDLEVLTLGVKTGSIHSSRVLSAGVEADEGERVFEDKPKWSINSSADNYVVPALELQPVWREGSADDYEV